MADFLGPTFASWIALVFFVIAYFMVFMEERTQMDKSKPLMIVAGLIWLLVLMSLGTSPESTHKLVDHFREAFLEFAELMMFLVVAMTYVSAMENRGLFNWTVVRFIGTRVSEKRAFWILGGLTFFLSPIIDNLTAALVMGTVSLALGKDRPEFMKINFINVVVASNAGGAFSPFGDVTTLMVWQAGKLPFIEFFHLFLPSLASWIVTGLILQRHLSSESFVREEMDVKLAHGAFQIGALFLFTIAITVGIHQAYHMPPAFGMMFGLGLLKLYGYKVQRNKENNFNIFAQFKGIEWRTLLFFYGVILAIAGLAAFGWLQLMADYLFGDQALVSPDVAAATIGIISAIVDNIPITYASLAMNPVLSDETWLLFTFAVGCGGSLLATGSAAGIAMMGMAPGIYTFRSHLRHIGPIFLGLAIGVAIHSFINT